ncbi:MAG TPA: hypothetical protein VGO68_06495 [Pyrinomonadaceae bacterium]|jgi:hypothetical protein|nr:hypothetical protein [Pyrinomonadaceae bacterium]
MRDKVEIAFRRQVRASWLEQGMALCSHNVPWSEARGILSDRVAAENPGKETIRKVLEHIRRIWFEPPKDSIPLHQHALSIFRADGSPENRLILNWGMAIAAYPFVGSVGEALGRQLKLQPEVKRATVQSRLREQYGDRDFVNRITRYNVSSFLEWGIIDEIKPRGVYIAGAKVRARSTEIVAWLMEAIMISRATSQMAFGKLSHHPILFPLSLETFNAATLRSNPRLVVTREGLNEEFVLLRMNSNEATQLNLNPLDSSDANKNGQLNFCP